jgi:hypothetical protein
MDVTLHIPDDMADQLTGPGGDLSRAALEAVALEALRAGRIAEAELGSLLRLARLQIDGFLRARGIYEDYSLEDFEKERQALEALGL